MKKNTGIIRNNFDFRGRMVYDITRIVGDLMNQKAFTLMELLAVVILLAILAAIATGAYYNHLSKSRQKSFEMAEKTLVNDVKNAYADCLSGANNNFCNSHPDFGYQNETIYLKELISTGYSERIKNPYNTDSYCDEDLSYIKVTSNNTNANNHDISYQVCLVCGDNRSSTCSN